MENYTHIFFDLGHVLILADDYTNACTKLLELAGEDIQNYPDVEPLAIEVYESELHNEYCRGEVSSDDYYQHITTALSSFTQKNLKLKPQDVQQAIATSILDYDKELLELLTQLRTKGYKIIITTDTHEWQSIRFREILDIDSLASKVYESHIFGQTKKDPDYFTMVCNELHIKPQQVVLIDDNPEVNNNATKSGIMAPGYKDCPQIKAELEKLAIFWQ